MPVRDQGAYEAFTSYTGRGFANDTPVINRDNFEYGGVPGGAEDERSRLFTAYQGTFNRPAPVVNDVQAQMDLARAMQARQGQMQGAALLEAQMGGAVTPQQAQLAQALRASQAAQTSLARSGTGLAAVAGADRDAYNRGQQIGLEGANAMALQRALDVTSARDQLAGLYSGVAAGDVQQRGIGQQAAYGVAGLRDAQRARDDEMARFYMQERYRIGKEQLSAGMGYEQQDFANKSGQANITDANAARRDAWNMQDTAAATRAIGDTSATLANAYDRNTASDEYAARQKWGF